jgi:hypothetical protein
MFNIYPWIYSLIAIGIIGGGTYKLYGMNQSLGAFIFFLGSLALCIIYGLRWLRKPSIFSGAPVSWPPTINTCPDYLTYYSRKMPDGSTVDTCIDLVGVSRNGSLKLFPKSGIAPTTDDYFFTLSTKGSDPASRNSELCQRAITFGLTWEGITNGESCIKPDGSNVSPAAAGSICPSS